MAGGLSIICCLTAWAFTDRGASVYTVSVFAVVLSYFVNNPHFLASYFLIYKDFRARIFRDIAYFWAAVFVPLVLAGLFVATLVRQDAWWMAHLITAMFFLVGWHYVKQVFGCVIVSSARRKIFYAERERQLLLANLFLTWFMSWVSPHTQAEPFDYYGIKYYSLNLPPQLLYGAYALVAITGLALVRMLLRRYIATGEKPAPPAVAAVVAIYAWYIPVAHHPGFSYLIPFFHSLQYMSFVWILKRNQIGAEIKSLTGEAWRAAWIKKFGGFTGGIWITGLLAFDIVPPLIDWLEVVPKGPLGQSPVLVSAILFINIHHYFIDNVIWRSSNATVKAYLFETKSDVELSAVSQKAA